MTKTRTTTGVLMDGNEDTIFTAVGLTDTYFEGKIMAKELASGDNLTVRVYNRNDGVSHYPFDSDVVDYVSGNNGTITYNSNLKRLYKFEGNLNDSTTNAANGTLAAGTATYVTGKEGQAFSFNGSTYITAADTSLPTGTNDRSISCWVYPTSFSVYPTVVWYGTYSTNEGCVFYIDNTGHASFSDVTHNYGTTTALSLNTWTFVTWVISSSGTNLKIYLNGVQDSSQTITAINTVNADSLTIGQNHPTNAIFSGNLDELRIYSSALSAAQVSALYMVGKYGQSHTFDGGEYISNSTPTGLPTGNNAFSVAFWANPTSEASTSTLVSYGTNSAGEAVIINLTTSGAILVSKQGTTIMTSTGTLSTGSYQHVVVTSDGTTTKVYINGSVDATTGASSFNTVIGSLYMGDLFGGSQPFTGQLDDLRIYSRALSASDVTDLYNSPAPMKTLLYSKNYGGPLSPTNVIFVPYITSTQYTLTCQQTTSSYYKFINAELYEVT